MLAKSGEKNNKQFLYMKCCYGNAHSILRNDYVISFMKELLRVTHRLFFFYAEAVLPLIRSLRPNKTDDYKHVQGSCTKACAGKLHKSMCREAAQRHVVQGSCTKACAGKLHKSMCREAAQIPLRLDKLIGTYASRFHIGILQYHECH